MGRPAAFPQLGLQIPDFLGAEGRSVLHREPGPKETRLQTTDLLISRSPLLFPALYRCHFLQKAWKYSRLIDLRRRAFSLLVVDNHGR